MQESLGSAGLWIVLAAAGAGLVGFAMGRMGGAAARRLRGVERALAEERAAHDRVRTDYDAYRGRVTDHFSETSERLHDLTLQYRSVYEHLAKGASELCPEGFSKLEGGLGLDALPEEITPRTGRAAEAQDELEQDDPAAEGRPEPPTPA